MPKTIHIALIGDYDATVTAHRAIPLALHLSAEQLGVEVVPEWVHTTRVGSPASELKKYHGIWCVPASPYASTAGALSAIQFARQAPRPFLGTCGGFQHALLEYARNVLGHGHADHAEMNPDTAMPIIAPLTCSLVEQSRGVLFDAGSRLQAIYGTNQIEEEYHCNYGLNPEYERLLTVKSGLHVVARDRAGEVRAVELAEHSFFIATLFQPERFGLRGLEHPLITAFVAATLSNSTEHFPLTPSPSPQEPQEGEGSESKILLSSSK